MFDFGILERSNKPSPVLFKKKNLNQNASQMRCLMLHIPFIFFDLLNHENAATKKIVQKVWKSIEYLLKIDQIISSSHLTEENLNDLTEYTHTYLHSLKKTLNIKLTSKLHFMTHYANTMRAMGPITNLQMMRGDAKHQTFVRFAKSTKSFVNICSTLAEKHQEMMESELRTKMFCDQIQTSKASKPAIEDGKLRTGFEGLEQLFVDHFQNMDEVIVRNIFTANSFRFQKGLFVLLLDQMYRIDAILQHKKLITFLCTHFPAVKFHEYANCVQVKNSNKQLLIDFSDLKCYRSFQGICLNGEIQIIAENLDMVPIYEALL